MSYWSTLGLHFPVGEMSKLTICKRPGVSFGQRLTFASFSPEPWRTCWKLRNPDLAAWLRADIPPQPSKPPSRAIFISLNKRASLKPHCQVWGLDSQGTGERGWGLGT